MAHLLRSYFLHKLCLDDFYVMLPLRQIFHMAEKRDAISFLVGKKGCRCCELRSGLVQGDGEIVARWTLHVQVVKSISELS